CISAHSLPASHFAGALLFLMIARTLAVFDIENPAEDGVVIEPDTEFTSGNISHPPEYKYSIQPRSDEVKVLLMSLAGDSEHI
ncbi:hypothetical protein WOLCODRAFT_77161, partial [Wolfiporia cocos MD-104 SS10]